MSQEQNRIATGDPAVPIPDISVPNGAPHDLGMFERWNQQAWPPITFGVPAGWTDVPATRFAWLPEERRIPPDAPILLQSHIVAAVEHPAVGGEAWQVQLRMLDARALADYVMGNPAAWSAGRRLIGQPLGPVEQIRAGDLTAVMFRYSFRTEIGARVFYEAWLADGERGYYFAGGAPAPDEAAFGAALRTMLRNARVQGTGEVHSAAPALVVPAVMAVERYRCGVIAHLPVTLENVTASRPGMFVIGSSSLMAWAMLGAAAATIWGHARAAGMEGQTRMVPASGEAALMDDRMHVRALIAPEVDGVRLRGDSASRTLELEIPYRLIRRTWTDASHVYIDIVGRGVLRIEPQDRGDFAQWLAHLTYEKIWQQPLPLALQMELQVAGWCQQDRRYTFGLPAQWVQADPRPLAQYAKFFRPSLLRAGVLLEADTWQPQVFVIENGPAQEFMNRVDVESLAALLVAAGEIAPVGPVQAATLGGEPVALMRGVSNTPDGAADRCYGAFVRGGILFALWYGVVGGEVGDGAYERWLPDFHTMAATWHWY